MGLYENIDRMWFGTEEKSVWIETPETGADVSSLGQSANSVLANGGGAARNSWDSHKVFQFSWGNSASPSMASLLQSYRNGSYGRGLLYFYDPMYYRTNLLPKRWADPSMAVNWEAEPIVPDANPTSVPQVSTSNNYPVTGATYSLPASYSSQTNSSELFLPIPEGFTLVLGAAYSGAGQVYARTNSGITVLPQLGLSDPQVASTSFAGVPWVRLGVRNTSLSAASLTIVGMTARIASQPTSDLLMGPWMSGEGHSGCRFQGNPTVINYTGVSGGQIGLSAIFQEVGAWE